MECDSVHSNVEKVKKHENVNLPVVYIRIIGSARKGKPGEYGVKYIDYTFLKNFKVCDIKIIKPSRDVGAPYVVHIRQLRYKPDGMIEINLTYEEDKWQTFSHKLTLRNITPSQMYVTPLPISFMKYPHLQQIKTTIAKDYHYFYDNLLHHSRDTK